MPGLLNEGKTLGKKPRKVWRKKKDNRMYNFDIPFDPIVGWHGGPVPYTGPQPYDGGQDSWVCPYSERVVVRELTDGWHTKAGLIIPEHIRTAEEYYEWGEVVGVGMRVTEDLRFGDKVLFEAFTGIPDGEGNLFVWQKHVWMVVGE